MWSFLPFSCRFVVVMQSSLVIQVAEMSAVFYLFFSLSLWQGAGICRHEEEPGYPNSFWAILSCKTPVWSALLPGLFSHPLCLSFIFLSDENNFAILKISPLAWNFWPKNQVLLFVLPLLAWTLCFVQKPRTQLLLLVWLWVSQIPSILLAEHRWRFPRSKHISVGNLELLESIVWTHGHINFFEMYHLPLSKPHLSAVLSCFSGVQLCVTPWTVAHQTPLSMGLSRQEYWSGLPNALLQGIFPTPLTKHGWIFTDRMAENFKWFINSISYRIITI